MILNEMVGELPQLYELPSKEVRALGFLSQKNSGWVVTFLPKASWVERSLEYNTPLWHGKKKGPKRSRNRNHSSHLLRSKPGEPSGCFMMWILKGVERYCKQ